MCAIILYWRRVRYSTYASVRLALTLPFNSACFCCTGYLVVLICCTMRVARPAVSVPPPRPRRCHPLRPQPPQRLLGHQCTTQPQQFSAGVRLRATPQPPGLTCLATLRERWCTALRLLQLRQLLSTPAAAVTIRGLGARTMIANSIAASYMHHRCR